MTIDMRKPEDREAGSRVHVYIDGVEITHRCFAASEEDMYAKCYVVDRKYNSLISSRVAPKPHQNAWDADGV